MFFLSSTSSSHRRIDQVVGELIGLGVINIELSGNLLLYRGWEEELVSIKQKQGLNLLMHNYFPPPLAESFVLNLASNRSDIRESNFKLISEAVRLMDNLTVPLYSIHSGQHIDVVPKDNNVGFELDNNSELDKSAAENMLYQNIDYLMSGFFKRKHKFAVENFFPFEFSKEKDYTLISKPDEILNFIKFSQKYPNLGLLLDLGHLSIAADVFNFDPEVFTREIFFDYPDKLFELHLSENEGRSDSHRVHKTNSWQFNLLEEQLQRIRNIPVIFEWHSKTNTKEEIIKGLEMIKDRFKGVDFGASSRKENLVL